MESKLEAYRIRKRRKETLENIKTRISKMLPFFSKTESETEKATIICVSDEKLATTTDSIKEKVSSRYKEQDEESIDACTSLEVVEESADLRASENNCLKYTLWIVYFLFWITCYAIAIELKFGYVYLIFSALFGIYFNTRTGPKKEGEISAYSVFNENCEAIDGTLNAEQFEREIRYGPTGVR